MRSPDQNPFVPGHDAIPEVWAGRAAELSDFADYVRVRRLAGVYERGRVILGDPGIGKSVLARRIAADAAALGDIVIPSIRVSRKADPLKVLANALTEAIEAHSLGERVASGLMDALRLLASIRLGDVAVTRTELTSVNTSAVVAEALKGLGVIARESGHCVVLHIDEVQNVAADRDALSELLIALGNALVETVDEMDRAGNTHTRYLPIIVYLSGLPSLVDEAARTDIDKAGATFARRFRPVPLSWLPDDDIRVALEPFTTGGWATGAGDHVTATADAVDAIIGWVAGDPFLFQLLGAAAWDARPDGPVITVSDVARGIEQVTAEANAHIRRMVDRLPELELDLLMALIALPESERTLTAAAHNLKRTATDLGTTARRLEERHLIRRGRPVVVTARHVERQLLAVHDSG